jgi:hypothetical protein
LFAAQLATKFATAPPMFDEPPDRRPWTIGSRVRNQPGFR